MSPGGPPKIGLGRGLWPGGGRSGLTGAAAAAAARTPAARRGARSAPPPAPGAGPPLLPCTPLFPSEPAAWKPKSRGCREERGRVPLARAAGTQGASLEEPGIWRQDLLTPPGPGVPAHSPSSREQRRPGAQAPPLPGPRGRSSHPPPFSGLGIHSSRPSGPGTCVPAAAAPSPADPGPRSEDPPRAATGGEAEPQPARRCRRAPGFESCLGPLLPLSSGAVL